jgi:hypothetical protein
MSSTTIRYAVTCLNKDGVRMLCGPAQGRFMLETPEQAFQALADTLANNSEERLASVYGKQAIGTFRVTRFACWSHGDPRGIYSDDVLERP